MSERGTSVIIQLNDTPISFPRPITNDKLRQNHTMMFYQQLVMKEARSALRANSLDVFKNPVSVEIEVSTLSSFQTFTLENVIKAIFDGLNRHVIANDSLITHAQIWLKKAQQRYRKDLTKVRVEDLVNGNNITFSLDLPCVEKKNAFVYSIGGALDYDPQSLAEITNIRNVFSLTTFTATNKYDICHMLFYTADMKKDVDNMFLMYVDQIRDLGLLDSTNTIGIGMYKRHADEQGERTIINLISK